MNVCDKKAQGTIEYLILVAVVIIVVLLFIGRGGVLEKSINGVIRQSLDVMVNSADNIF